MAIVKSAEPVVVERSHTPQPPAGKALFETEQAVVTLTPAELEDFGKGIVQRTMVEMGYKAHRHQNGKITRKDMIEVLGSRRKFEQAVKSGRLRTRKDGPSNSRIWAKREDFEKFLHDHTNKLI